MTSRERILAALDRGETDRLPVDFGGTDCSSVHATAYHNLRKHLGIEPRPIRLGCLGQQIVEPDVEMLERMGGDAVMLPFHPRQWRLWESGYGFEMQVPDRWRPEMEPDGSAVIRDSEGRAAVRRAKHGLYFDPVAFPARRCRDAAGPRSV